MSKSLHELLNMFWIIGLVFFKPVVLMCILNWHLIAYLGLPEIGYWEMMGVMVVMLLLTKNHFDSKLWGENPKLITEKLIAISIMYLTIITISWIAI